MKINYSTTIEIALTKDEATIIRNALVIMGEEPSPLREVIDEMANVISMVLKKI